MTIKETISLAEARKDIHYMQSEIAEIKESIKNLPSELVKALDERYAIKEETVTKKAVRVLYTAALGFGMFLVAIWHEINK